MAENDDTRWKKRHSNPGPLLQPTRRSVLIGGAALLAVDPAKAQAVPSEPFQLDFLDKARRNTVVLLNLKQPERTKDVVAPKFLLSWDRREFGPDASFQISRKSAPYFANGEPKPEDECKTCDAVKVPEWLPVEWTLAVKNCSFPGNEQNRFNAVFVFKRKSPTEKWTVSARMGRWWPSRVGDLTAVEINLSDFLTGSQPLAFRVNSEQNNLLKSLFGERVEARTAFDLQMDRDLGWSIDTGQRAVTAKTPRLYILDIPLEFGRMVLRRIRSDPPTAGDPPSATPTAASATTPGKGGDPSARSIAKDRLLFEAEFVYGRPLASAQRKNFQLDGLYGAFENVTGFTKPTAGKHDQTDVAPIWTFDFATARLAGIDTAVSFTLDKAAVVFDESGNDGTGRSRPRIYAAIRHWGYPDHAVAGCIVEPARDAPGIGRLDVRHGPPNASISEGPFEFAGFEIVRQLDATRGVVTRLRVQPPTKETAARLQLGNICVAALPAVSDQPGLSQRVPPIEIEAVDADDDRRRTLRSFGGRLALSSAAVMLPDRIELPDGDNGPGRATEKTKQQRVVPGTHITRLGFIDANVQIYMPALGPPPVSSADAVIPIGPAVAPAQALPISAGNHEMPSFKAVIDLGRAHLTVLRPSDLLALKFRFSGLELSVAWPPAADKVAELTPRGGRSPGRPYAQAADGAATPRDERPLLVVEFPPQHVVERAYFRRLPSPLDLPELTRTEENGAELDELKRALSAPKHWSSVRGPAANEAAESWRNWVAALLRQVYGAGEDTVGSTRDERIELRRHMRHVAIWPDDRPLFPGGEDLPADRRMKVLDFDQRFTNRAFGISPRAEGAAAPRGVPLPEEQRLYAGPEFLDPDARRIALQVLRELKQEEDANRASGSASMQWPSVKLESREWEDIFKQFGGKPGFKDPPEQTWPDAKTAKDEKFTELLTELELARERRDREYAAFRSLYRKLAREFGPKAPPEYFGAAWFKDVLGTSAGVLDEFRQKLVDANTASGDEDFGFIVPARLSGPSRIAFRVDCEDYESDRPGGGIPFTLEGLTNWGGMDMAVVRRAERLMEPLQGTRLPPRWGRRALTNEAAILRFQRFTPSDRWGHTPADTPPRTPALAAVRPAQRLAEVYASAVQPPDAFQTAIELPFRLFLSPAQDATWTTSSPRVRRDAGLPDNEESFRELWTARLTGSDDAAGLRAIWSPDFRAEALLSTQPPAAPPMGPYAPWALPRSFGLRLSPDREIEQFRTGLEAFDRHELVVLSSVHGLPVLGRRAPSGDLAPDADQIEPPAGFRLQGLLPENIDGKDADMTAIYRPKAMPVSELSLSALGGNLDIDAGFQPPASARALDDGRNLFDALSVERWRQRTILGRDVLVEVVYKGFLFPLGHRASLVKLTERRFVAVEGRESPIAILVQRLFLRVGKREKRFPAEGQPNRGSRMPCDRVTILTRQSPDLVDARSEEGDADGLPKVLSRGKIKLEKVGTGLCMWPRTAARSGAEVWFEMQIGDEAVPVRLPLIFVDNIAANDEATIKALIGYYNEHVPNAFGQSPTRHLMRNGQPVVMAPEFKPGDTTFETQWWSMTAEGRELNPPRKNDATFVIDNSKYTRDSFMEGQDQPPFYPVVAHAKCRLKSVERLTGGDPLWAEVAFDGEYVAYGFVDQYKEDADRTAQSEIYLRIIKSLNGDDTDENADKVKDTLPLDFKNRGDLGGGVARPTMDVVAMSRQFGPINGGAKGALDSNGAVAAKTPDPPPSTDSNVLSALERIERFTDAKSVFPRGKFLGIMELSDLIKKVFGIDLHPKLLEVIEYGAASVAGAATEVRSALVKALIEPAATAVAEVSRAWLDLASKRLGNNAQVPTLEAIYPQVGSDIAALQKSLDAAQNPATSDTDFFGSLSSINQAARRLTRTIDGIARDPLAAAAGAQVELFRKLLGPIDTIRNTIDGFNKLKDVPSTLLQAVIPKVRTFAEEQMKRMVASSGTTLPATADAILAAVDASIPDKGAWTLDVLASLPGRLANELKIQAMDWDPSSSESGEIKAAIDTLEDMQQTIDQGRKAVEDAKDELKAARDDVKAAGDAAAKELLAAVDRAEQRAIEKAVEVILSRPGAVGLRIAVDASKLWSALPSPPLDQTKIVGFLSALAPAFDILAQLGQAKLVAKLYASAAHVCKATKSTLSAGLETLLPKADILEIAGGCYSNTAGDPTLVDSCSASDLVKGLHELAIKARDGLKPQDFQPDTFATERKNFDSAAVAMFAAIDNLNKAQKALDKEIKNIPDDSCALPRPELLAALRDLVARQRSLTHSIEILARTITSLIEQKLLPGILDAALQTALGAFVNLLVAALDQLPGLTLFANIGKSPDLFGKFADALSALAGFVRPQLPETAATLDQLAAEQRTHTDLDLRQKLLKAARDALQENVKSFLSKKTLDSAAVVAAVEDAKRELILTQETVTLRLEHALGDDLYNLIAPAVAAVNDDLTALIDAVSPLGDSVLPALQKIYEVLVDQRTKLEVYVESSASKSPTVARVLDTLARELDAGSSRADLFKVYAADDPAKSERLKLEQTFATIANGNWSSDKVAAFAALGTLSAAWKKGPVVAVLLRRFSKINGAFLRTVVIEALDLRALRAELDRIVRELVPTRATLSYDLSSPVNDFSLGGIGKVFIAVPGTRLDIKTRASVDLLNPATPDARIDGHMGPFGIQLFGSFDVVLLNFRGLDFRGGGGRPAGFDVRFGDITIGEKAKFLKQLEPYVSPKSGLPPVRPMRDKPGIEATYGINLGSFGVGTLSFSNVSLNAGARLPFGATDEAEFIISIGRSDAPFLISSTIFGGGGYLALLANGRGFIGLETSFDYGGVFAFGFGPLTGAGQITLGLYFRAARGESARLGMNFMVRGAANIACFSFSASLFVRLTYQNNVMEGVASFTFTFSIGIDDISYTFDAHVSQGASAGQGSPTALLDLPGMPALTQFAANGRPDPLDAFAIAGAEPTAGNSVTGPALSVRAPSQRADWRGYRRLFDTQCDPLVPV